MRGRRGKGRDFGSDESKENKPYYLRMLKEGVCDRTGTVGGF